MRLTKTTFELEPELLRELKTAAARAGKSVRELLTEGARWVLGEYEGRDDQKKLLVRAQAARDRLRQGYGPALPGLEAYTADTIDQLLYVQEPQFEYRSRPIRKRKK